MSVKTPKDRSLEISYLMGRFHSEHLVRVYRLFEGDLPAAIVFATVAQHNLQRFYDEIARHSDAGFDELVESSQHLAHLRHCNALSVSASTGVPRETVRRKVRMLEVLQQLLRPGMRVADIACGEGIGACHLAAAGGHDIHYRGIDLDPEACAVARGVLGDLPALAGSAVLEPGLSAGMRWNTGAQVRLEPGLSVSWYPGIPLTLETGFRWTAGMTPDAGWTSEWMVTVAAAGALGGVLLFTGAGSCGHLTSWQL